MNISACILSWTTWKTVKILAKGYEMGAYKIHKCFYALSILFNSSCVESLFNTRQLVKTFPHMPNDFKTISLVTQPKAYNWNYDLYAVK